MPSRASSPWACRPPPSAWADWWVHLVNSPGKQLALLDKARRKARRLLAYATRAQEPEAPWCIEPLPQDHRFRADAWRQWPFNLFAQSFLLVQQWWFNATTGVPGVSRHHEEVVEFTARQLLDVVAPSNFTSTNPEVLAATAAQSGANLIRGGRYLAEDVWRAATGEPAEADPAFRPGVDVAVTPGRVVYRNGLIELIQYAPTTAEVRPEPVLFVPAWIMKYYILDLSPANSLVRYLVAQGHTVFMISWKNPNSHDRHVSFDEYRTEGIVAAVDAIGRIQPGRRVHATGYCLGGTDHVAPWPSVYKLMLTVDSEVTFVLTTGGHNAGVVNEPGHHGRTYQVARRGEGDPYVDPERWRRETPVSQGSWWPEWQAWLTEHSTGPEPPPPLGTEPLDAPGLGNAPGRYVLVR